MTTQEINEIFDRAANVHKAARNVDGYLCVEVARSYLLDVEFRRKVSDLVWDRLNAKSKN